MSKFKKYFQLYEYDNNSIKKTSKSKSKSKSKNKDCTVGDRIKKQNDNHISKQDEITNDLIDQWLTLNCRN